jgi:hypothetical protein
MGRRLDQTVRYTHEDVERAFGLLCQLVGKTEGVEASQWHLDHARDYGGYIVTERVAGGGEIRPVWDQRLTATRFCECVGFAMSVVEKLRDEHESWDSFLRRMQNRPTRPP